MITNQPKSSQIVKQAQDKAKVNLLYLLCIFFAFKISQFFSVFFVSHKNPYKIGRIRISQSCLQGLPTLQTHSLAIYNVEKLRFVPLSFPSTLICYILVLLWLILALHWRYTGDIPLHCGVIPARCGIFRYHSCPFHFTPASFCLVPVYSGLFQYIPFRSIPFLCLVTPVM